MQQLHHAFALHKATILHGGMLLNLHIQIGRFDRAYVYDLD